MRSCFESTLKRIPFCMFGVSCPEISSFQCHALLPPKSGFELTNIIKFAEKSLLLQFLLELAQPLKLFNVYVMRQRRS